MLVLSRRALEEINIGHDIVITIVEIEGNRVKIGITAPDDVGVHRQEIFDRIKQELNNPSLQTRKRRQRAAPTGG